MSTSHLKLLAALPFIGGAAVSNAQSILKSLPSSPRLNVSTVPANGDENPYGVAYVPRRFNHRGMLDEGDILVSNFNNSSNLQGTGSTIVRFNQKGESRLFFQGSNLGLTTALGVLRNGYVLVGNAPTTDGTFQTLSPGSLIVLDSRGKMVTSLTDIDLLDAPWDLTISDDGFMSHVFVSNVLNGTITRLDVLDTRPFTVVSMTRIGSHFTHNPNAAALAVGPTGLAYDASSDSLYVASTGDNAIYKISNAASRTTDAKRGVQFYFDNTHLHGPLALVLAPNGDLIAANGDAINPDAGMPSEMVEIAPNATFVAMLSVDSSGQGGAFGLALFSRGKSLLQLAAVDDISNTLKVWDIKRSDHDGDGDKH